MTKLFLVAIIFFATYSSILAATNNIQPGSCGQTSVPNRVNSIKRILGGDEATPHSIPFIVSFRSQYADPNEQGHFCGGALIRVSDSQEESDIVVTAAHCWAATRYPAFQVVAGAHDKTQLATGEWRVNVQDVVPYPTYDLTKTTPEIHAAQKPDMLIVKLATPIKFSPTIQPVCLPEKDETVAYGAQGIVAGWGQLGYDAGYPDKLQQVVLPVLNVDICDVTQLCAGYYQSLSKDNCPGDSGGPYFMEGANGYTLQGVVNYGGECKTGEPGYYARVAWYVDWIKEQARAMTSVKLD